MEKPDSKAECCSAPEMGCRNNYFDGKRLSTDSFRVEQRYLLERRRLLNRAIHGWGVVYGFSISSEGGRLKIGPGLALDECGRELLQVGTVHAGFKDLLVQQDDAQTADDPGERWLLSVHYAEQSTGQVTVTDSCRCEHAEWDRTCETVRYSLRCIPSAECCLEPECELQCHCGKGGCCEQHAATPGAPLNRGGCCLCDHLTYLQPGAESCTLTEIDDPCGSVRADLRHGVPLACVTLSRYEYGRPTLGDVEPCGPRRLVKRNDLLFDLIRGCDLTRICEIGWAELHREIEIPFERFSDALGTDYRNDQYVTRDFWVRFSRPVRRDTLLPDCFAMTVMSGEREGGWWQVFRVPIVDVKTDSEEELVDRATVVVDGAWVEDGVRGRRSIFLGSPTYVEIEVRGDFIVDCNGQTVDANAVGLSPAPTGNGTPGGTFVSGFRVAARSPEASYKGASS